MDLNAVMDEVEQTLKGIDGLRVHGYPPDSLVPPAAIVDYPEVLTFDATFGRGMDRVTLPVVVVVGRVSDRSSRRQLAAYAAGDGDQSVKAVVEAGAYEACDSVRVTDVEFDVYGFGGVDHVVAIFALDIAGQGGS